MTTPNASLKAVRQGMRMSQEELARAVRAAGQRAGEPNGCSKRLVQRWESGNVTTPRGAYARALEYVTGQPVENLGFKPADETYGMDRGQAMDAGEGAWIPLEDPKAKGPLTGVWLSQYEYESSSRGHVFADAHYVVIIQHGARLQVRSVPASPSKVMMDMTVNGQVVTGTWTEQTNPEGYYQGSVYHGAIQFLMEPTGHRMSGKWVGFGRDFDLNTGPWTLRLITNETDRETLRRYNTRPELKVAT